MVLKYGWKVVDSKSQFEEKSIQLKQNLVIYCRQRLYLQHISMPVMTLSILIISINLLSATHLFFAERRSLAAGFGQILMRLLIYPGPRELYAPIFYLFQHALEHPAFIARLAFRPYSYIFPGNQTLYIKKIKF